MFIPAHTPDNYLGLPGFYLTTRDGMKESEKNFFFNIYGPVGFKDFMASAKYFIGETAWSIKWHEYDNTDMDTDLEESKGEQPPINQDNFYEDSDVQIRVVGIRYTQYYFL